MPDSNEKRRASRRAGGVAGGVAPLPRTPQIDQLVDRRGPSLQLLRALLGLIEGQAQAGQLLGDTAERLPHPHLRLDAAGARIQDLPAGAQRVHLGHESLLHQREDLLLLLESS